MSTHPEPSLDAQVNTASDTLVKLQIELFEAFSAVAEEKPANPYASLAKLLLEKSPNPDARILLEQINWENAINNPPYTRR